VILSTGYGLVPAYYTTLAESLASAGFLVAGIANTYSAPVVVFPDGRTVVRDAAGSLPEKGTAAQMSASAARLVGVWSADIRFVIDKLLSLNNTRSSQFFQSIDPGRIAAIGHSFGGAASAAAALSDPRIGAVIDLDGTLWGDAAHHAVRVPTMIVTSSPEPTATESASFADALASGALELTLDRSRHFDFSDYAVLYEPLIHLSGLLGSIPGRRALAVTAAYVKVFLDHVLNGAATPLLRGPTAAYPEMRFDTAGVQS
jgi:predicted dienelactone hydrolase